jgi:ElaB/YqjD/DUF883 family membrane-anchored ribosome-binding protein
MAIENSIENDPEAIRKQMQETRESLQDKLETLEQQVTGSVQEATEAISETVATVKDTVEAVKETVKETVVSVKDTFDINRQVQNHPWLMVGGATLAGFVVGQLLNSGSKRPSAQPQMPVRSGYSAATNGHSAPSRQSWWDFVASHYKDELDKVKALAIGAAGGVVQEIVVAEFAPEVAEKLKEIVAGITTKLGGKPIADFGFHTEAKENDQPNGTPEFSRMSQF